MDGQEEVDRGNLMKGPRKGEGQREVELRSHIADPLADDACRSPDYYSILILVATLSKRASVTQPFSPVKHDRTNSGCIDSDT